LKILLDAHFSPDVADLLVQRGHDVDAVLLRADLANDSSDAVVMAVAHAEGRAVVTNNVKDFRPIAAQRIASGHSHSGLILVPANRPRSRSASGSLADAIEQVIRANPGGIAGSERWS
jgi:hypothetical protein